jgi:hypothetical protein
VLRDRSSLCELLTSCLQGVSLLVDITAGGDFLGLCDQKSSYKHVSDFGRLRSYGHFFNSRTRRRVNRVLWYQLAGDVLAMVAYHPVYLVGEMRALGWKTLWYIW